MKKSLSDLAYGINSNYIQTPDRTNKQRFKLDTETSRPYFQNKILSFPKQFNEDIVPNSQEEEILENSYNIIKKYILKNFLANNQKIEQLLSEYRDKVLSLKIVYIELENKNDAYIIFDTLNDRGKNLDLSDKVKSYIFRILKTEHTDVNRHQDIWNEIQEKINKEYKNINLDNYIRYQWISKNGYCTEPQVYEKLKTSIKDIDTEKAKEYLFSLKEDIDYFLFINNPQKNDLEFIGRDNIMQIKNSLKALNIFKIKQTIPVLISLFRAYRRGTVSIKNVKRFLTYIEHFHFMFNTIYSGRPSVFQKTYYSLAKNLSDTNVYDKNPLFNHFIFDNKILPNNDILLKGFTQKIYTKNKAQDKKLIQYMLSKIDEYERKVVPIDYNKMTIEHIIPQSKISTLGDEIIGQIGNLILVTPELQILLDNKPVKDKIEILKKHNYPITSFGEYKNIDEKIIIKNRTNKLADLAFKEIWSL